MTSRNEFIMKEQLLNFWLKLDKDRKDVIVLSLLVIIIALTFLPFIPKESPEYFPLIVLISQFLVNLLLMNKKYQKIEDTILDIRSRKSFSKQRDWFLILYLFLMFPGCIFVIASGISLIAFVPLIISRSYLFINKLPLSAMNLFFLIADKNYHYDPAERLKTSMNNYHDEVRNNSTYSNNPGNVYYNSND
jgi:hypothetical protein